MSEIVRLDGVKFSDAKEQKAMLITELTTAWSDMGAHEKIVGMNHPDKLVAAALKKVNGLAPLVFDDDLRVRFGIQMDDAALLDSNQKLKRLVNDYLLPWLKQGGFDTNTVVLTENKVCNPKGQCTKLTRALNQCLPEDIPNTAREMAQAISGAKRPPSNRDFVTAISVAFRGNVGMFISINPTDIATSTWKGGFSSCHRPGGEYFAGNMGLINTPSAMVAYVGTPERKTGRLWMYYLPEVQHIYQLKTYGTLPQQWRKAMRNAVQDMVDAEATWVHSTKRGIRTNNKDRAGAYVDTENLSVSYLQDKGFDAQAMVDMGSFICPSCGKTGNCPTSNDARRTGGCTSCPPVTICAGCGCGVKTGAKSWDGKNYCKTCFDGMTFDCAHCKEKHMSTDKVMFGEKEMCRYCYEHHITTCHECKKPAIERECSYVNDEPVCPTCYDEHMHTCHECGCNFDTRVVEFEGGVCATCISEQIAM